MKSGIKAATRHFLKTTTLHGFKYLCSPFCVDRAWWVVCCCVCACSGGALCWALWARFAQRPAILALLPASRHLEPPLFALCPSPHRLARLFLARFSQNSNTVNAPLLFYQIIRSKPVPHESALFLERGLADSNCTSLADMLMLVAPSCSEMIEKCRWQNIEEDCNKLFTKVVTSWGVCCIAWPHVLKALLARNSFNLRSQLDLNLRCSGHLEKNGCEFYTKYSSEEWVVPMELAAGAQYRAFVTYSRVKDTSQAHIVDTACQADPNYSRRHCFIQCKEHMCGCSHPLRTYEPGEDAPPRCSLTQMNCLTNFNLVDDACNCPQACTEVHSRIDVEQTSLVVDNTFDNFHLGANANASSATYLSIMVSDIESKIFDLTYTETWWSLLSSLGGVFNMFLGLGLFTALELLFFLLAHLPHALRRSRARAAQIRPFTGWPRR